MPSHPGEEIDFYGDTDKDVQNNSSTSGRVYKSPEAETKVTHRNKLPANEGTSNGSVPVGPTVAKRLARFKGRFFRAFGNGMKIQMRDEEWEYTEEAHVVRRELILAKHPEVKKLMGHASVFSFLFSVSFLSFQI